MNYHHFTIEERCCLGLPSEDSLNRLADFFGVEREELYSDKATETVIVEKNKTIFKAHR